MGSRCSILTIGLLASLAVCTTAAEPQPPRRADAAIEIVPLTPNASEINGLSLTLDSQYLISNGLIGSARDGRPRLWQVATGRLLRVIGSHDDDSGPASELMALPNGRALAVSDTTVEIWDLVTGQRVQKYGTPVSDIRRGALSRDGKLLFMAGSGRIVIAEVATGTVVRSFASQTKEIDALVPSPDGKVVLTLGNAAVRVWLVNSGRLVRTVKVPAETTELAFAGDARFLTGGPGAKTLSLWDLQTGRLIKSFNDSDISKIVVTPDGRKAITASVGRELRVWDLASGTSKFIGREYQHPREDFIVFPDGRRLAQGSIDNEISILDLDTGQELRKITPPSMVPTAFRITPDGGQLVWASEDKRLTLWDLRTAQPVRRLADAPDQISAMAFLPGGNQLLAAGSNIPFTVWDLASGERVRSFGGPRRNVHSIDVSPDRRYFISNEDEPALWGVQDGRKIETFGSRDSATFSADGNLLLNRERDTPEGSWEIWALRGNEPARTHNGRGNVLFLKDGVAVSKAGTRCENERLIKWALAIGPDKPIWSMELPCHSSIGFSSDGSRAILSSFWGYLALVDLIDGRLARQFEGHGNEITFIDMSLDGRYIFTVATDGLKVWSPDSDKPLVTMMAIDDSRWLTISPTGFFAGTRGGSELASIVRGLDVTSPEQMYQSLFAPDLIRERLAGDPDSEFKAAADVLNLRTVLDSGRVPQVALVSPAAGVASGDEIVTAQARIADMGGGIGRIEWRVNGVTAAVTNVTAAAGTDSVVSQALALEPGDNTVEVVAYNARNRLASLPAATTVRWTAPANQPRPKLYVIAVGIDKYEDAVFRRLSLAVADAKAFGAAMKAAGMDLYADVDVTYVLDKDATADALEQAIGDVGKRMHPRDAFIFFAAAHGKSENGRFHLIPQDYRSERGRPWTEGAIGQERLQDWFANRIRARRGVILLDTCESGALVAGRASGTDAANSEAALGRLNEATGRPVLTAAAADQVALEGYKGHGVFTYALLDTLANGDANNNGQIELSELAAHIQTLAPRLSRELSAGGTRSSRSRGFQAADERPFASRVAGFGQKPKTGSHGEDFPLVRRLVPAGSPPQ